MDYLSDFEQLTMAATLTPDKRVLFARDKLLGLDAYLRHPEELSLTDFDAFTAQKRTWQRELDVALDLRDRERVVGLGAI